MVQTFPGNDCLRARRSGEDVPNCTTAYHRQRNFLISGPLISACRVGLSRRSLDEDGSLGEGGTFLPSVANACSTAPSRARRKSGPLASPAPSYGDVTLAGEKFCEILRHECKK